MPMSHMWIEIVPLLKTLDTAVKVDIVYYEGGYTTPVSLYRGYPTQDAVEACRRAGLDFINYISLNDDGSLYIEVS